MASYRERKEDCREEMVSMWGREEGLLRRDGFFIDIQKVSIQIVRKFLYREGWKEDCREEIVSIYKEKQRTVSTQKREGGLQRRDGFYIGKERELQTVEARRLIYREGFEGGLQRRDDF